MLQTKVIRAWKDEEYRLSLSEMEREVLPPSPVGTIELSDEDLDHADGGTSIILFTLLAICLSHLICPQDN